MPIIKSAKKAQRQNIKRRKLNLQYLKKMRELGKKIKEDKTLLPQLYKALDKAVKRGVIKKNAAARKKSRITKLLSKVN